MPLYSWRCRDCGRSFDLPTRTLTDDQTCACGGRLRRDYSSVQLGRPAFQPHFNHAVGQFVNSDREFREELKRGAEKAGSAEYVPIYPGDSPRPTKDDHVFETQERTWRDKGLTRSKSTSIPLSDAKPKKRLPVPPGVLPRSN